MSNGIDDYNSTPPTRRRQSTLHVHQRLVRRPLRRLAAPELAAAQQAQAAAAEAEQAERERQAELENDLQMARDLQQGLLLAEVPSLHGWELGAISNPARELGGDLYDFLQLPDGRQAIMIGDVSGKGLTAALRMAVARTMFRYVARRGDSPAQTLAEINDNICNDIPQGMVTMLYIVLDPHEGYLQIANAGHTYALLLNGRVSELELTGMPLGVVPEMDYQERIVRMQPGDTVLLYTDGVTEAMNAQEEIFGTEHLQALLEANLQAKPRALMRLLLNELRNWSDHRLQDDDITVVVFRRRLQHLSDELRTVFADVLGTEAATSFWEEQIAQNGVRNPGILRQLTPEEWSNDLLPPLLKTTRAAFNRGIARELGQQIRLVLEAYRGSSSAASLSDTDFDTDRLPSV